MDSIVSILKNSVLAIVRILEVRDDPVNSSKTISSSPIKVEVVRVVVAAKEVAAKEVRETSRGEEDPCSLCLMIMLAMVPTSPSKTS